MGPMGFATRNLAEVVILRGITQITITVKPEEISNTGFGKSLMLQIDSPSPDPVHAQNSRPDPVIMIYQWCLPTVERLAPDLSIACLCLETLLHAPTYQLKLVADREDRSIHIVGEDECLYTPLFAVAPARDEELLRSHGTLAQFSASQVWLQPNCDGGTSLDTLQGRVVVADGKSLYFKPRIDGRESEFERELNVMSSIAKLNPDSRMSVPELRGIVCAGKDGQMIAGVLMSEITPSDAGTSLNSPGFSALRDCHGRWEAQVCAIVKILHAHGLVWGDVNPTNIMIDRDLNAWVIDFGGMNNVEFVDEEHRETVEGDWQGVFRIFREWLPRRAPNMVQ